MEFIWNAVCNKHQHTQMWMFPSCLSAALMASYKGPSLHSHLRRKHEVTLPCSRIKPRSGRETFESEHVSLQTQTLHSDLFSTAGSYSLIPPKLSDGSRWRSSCEARPPARSCRCRCYFSLQLLGAVDNQSWLSLTCMTWVWIIYGLHTCPDAEQFCKPAATSGNVGET